MSAPKAYVYLLRCADATFYIGTARDVAARAEVHNSGKGAKYTRPRRPVTVVFQEGPMTVSRALRREYQLKQLTRAQKEKLIAGEFELKLPRRSPKRRLRKGRRET
ncbi:MAG TPA: GIY-YIG nuclease family protein [Opitutaceae bacterium]